MTQMERAPSGIRTFALYRGHDESGVSGTGKVIEGVLFSTGLCIIHWLTPPPRGSINIWDSFEQMQEIVVGSHPTNDTVIAFDDGERIVQAAASDPDAGPA